MAALGEQLEGANTSQRAGGKRIALFAGIEVAEPWLPFLRLAVLHATHLAHRPETRVVEMQQTLNDPFLRGALPTANTDGAS